MFLLFRDSLGEDSVWGHTEGCYDIGSMCAGDGVALVPDGR